MICSFLFAALLFFICSVPLFYLQRSSFLFAAFLFFIFAAVPFFVCSASFLFAAFLFCLQRFSFVCSVSFLFAAFLLCLQRFFFVCSVSFLFAAFLFCLQRVPCGPPYNCPGYVHVYYFNRSLYLKKNINKYLIKFYFRRLPRSSNPCPSI